MVSTSVTLVLSSGSGVTTDWHMLVIVADSNPDTATGWVAELPSRSVPSATPPYWTKS